MTTLFRPKNLNRIIILLIAIAYTSAFCSKSRNGRVKCPLQSTPEEKAEALRQQAQKLKEEVRAFDEAKQEVINKEKRKREKVVAEKLERRLRYSAEVPILKGNGVEEVERVDFPPMVGGENESFIFSVEADLPLGLILGEDEGGLPALRVDELVESGNAANSGIQVGDILRACTATQTTMETPTWQLLAGGIGQPKTKRFMYSTDGRPFEEVMDAIGSNRMDPDERPAVLVFERVEKN